MASAETWKAIKEYFSPDELGKNSYDGMQDEFLLSLYRFRVAIGIPMIIHVGGGFAVKGHSTKSMHYRGRAVDFHFGGNTNISVRRAIVTAINSGLFGIGIYPEWKPKLGFHLDSRSPYKFNVWKKEGSKYLYLFGDFIK